MKYLLKYFPKSETDARQALLESNNFLKVDEGYSGEIQLLSWEEELLKGWTLEEGQITRSYIPRPTYKNPVSAAQTAQDCQPSYQEICEVNPPTGNSVRIEVNLPEVVVEPHCYDIITYDPNCNPDPGSSSGPGTFTNPGTTGPGGGGGSGSGSGGAPTVLPEDEIFKDPSFVGSKADCVYEKLLGSSEGFKKMIQKFDGEFPVSHLNFTLDYNMPSTINGTTSSSSINSYYIDIDLNGNTLSGRPILGIARTIAHETIHAEMYRKVKSVGGQVSINDFPGIFYYYTNHEDWQHEQMANHYVGIIVEILKAFDSNRHTNEYYSDLAWEGLQGTQVWNSLPQSDKNRIVQNITNTNQNGNKICN